MSDKRGFISALVDEFAREESSVLDGDDINEQGDLIEVGDASNNDEDDEFEGNMLN